MNCSRNVTNIGIPFFSQNCWVRNWESAFFPKGALAIMLYSSTRPIAAVALLATFALGACGSSPSTSGGTLGTSGGAVAPTLLEAVTFDSLAIQDQTRIAGDGTTVGIPGTAFGPLNATTTGKATYRGPGVVNVFERVMDGNNTTDTTVVDMLGTAAVEFDFETDTFDGRIFDMFAVNLEGETDLVGGELTVANGGQADPAGRPTLLEADATGSLEAFGTTYDIEVGLEGLLRGTNTNADDDIPVRAISLSGEGTVAGSMLLSEISIVGDKDAGNEGAFINR